MDRSVFPNFFEREPNLSLVSNSRISSFLKAAIYPFLKYLRYRQTRTSSGNVENTQPRFESPRRDPFRHPCLGFNVFFGTTGLDQLTNHCVSCDDTYFL